MLTNQDVYAGLRKVDGKQFPSPEWSADTYNNQHSTTA